MQGWDSDDFKQHRQEQQERHAVWNNKNMRRLAASGLTWTDRGETLLFRIEGKPRVDFYPSTGRWRNMETGETLSGGAGKFVRWFHKQQHEPKGEHHGT